MKRIKWVFALLAVALLVPVGYVVASAFRSRAAEESMRHRAIADRIFDETERELTRILDAIESRPYAVYRRYYLPENLAPGQQASFVRSPLAQLPAEPWLFGWFQVEPDGRVQSPLDPELGPDVSARHDRVLDLVGTRWKSEPGRVQLGILQAAGSTVQTRYRNMAVEQKYEAAFQQAQQNGLPTQAMAPSAWDSLNVLNRSLNPRTTSGSGRTASKRRKRKVQSSAYSAREFSNAKDNALPPPQKQNVPAAPPSREQVEVDLEPMVGRLVDADHLLLYRTVVLEQQPYRQGAVLHLPSLQGHLAEVALGGGLSEVASLDFSNRFSGALSPRHEADYAWERRFAEPFGALRASLSLSALPDAGSQYLVWLSLLLVFAATLGLFALYRMVAAVVSYSERRSNFVSAVSHELKTPLTSIRMYGEMLRDGMVADAEKQQRYYETITSESERLSRLIGNVLELSRIEKGNRELSLEVGRPGEVLEDVVESLRPHARNAGFSLELDVAEDLPSVRFERDALVQVLFNLVDNALKYARESQTKTVSLRCERDGPAVRIRVRDRGPGVDARQLRHVFEPFYRCEDEMTRRHKGTGIGLSLVQRLVAAMGGQVSARNVEEGGFEVALWLPVAA